MAHEYIKNLIKSLEEQQEANHDKINELMIANSELKRVLDELRTLK